MAVDPIYVQLTWEDADTGTTQQTLLQPPIALGRDSTRMPEELDGQPISRLELQHRQVSRYHALITTLNQQLFLTDHSANGSYLNGQPVHSERTGFTSRDTLRIGPFKITAALVHANDVESTELTHLTEVNRRPLEPAKNQVQQTAIVWIAGLLVFVAMAAGAWVLVSYALKQARPQSSELPDHLIQPPEIATIAAPADRAIAP